MVRILWIISTGGSVVGLTVFLAGAIQGPQAGNVAVAAIIGGVIAVIPYIMARSVSEMQRATVRKPKETKVRSRREKSDRDPGASSRSG